MRFGVVHRLEKVEGWISGTEDRHNAIDKRREEAVNAERAAREAAQAELARRLSAIERQWNRAKWVSAGVGIGSGLASGSLVLAVARVIAGS